MAKKQQNKTTKKAENNSTNKVLASKPSAYEVGDELEYRIQRLQMHMGYFVRRGRPIYTIGNLDRATDLDVYALRYVEPFSCEIVITECKSGSAGPLDRIFWLSGLKNYVKAKEALLVRKGTKWNIKEFAKQCQVQILDFSRIGELEKNLKIDPIDWPGLSDIGFLRRKADEWNQAISSDKKFWELYSTLESEISFENPFPAINYLLFQMRLLTKTFKETPSNSFYRYLFSECIIQLLIFCMRISEKCFDLKKDDIEGFIRKGLKYGNVEPMYAERFLHSAYNLARQAVLHYTKEEIEIDKSLFEMQDAPGTNGILKLVNGILNTYPTSLILPQTCDFLLAELFTKQYKAKGLLRKLFPQQYLNAPVNLVRWYLEVLIEMECCPSYILDTLQSDNIGNVGTEGKNGPVASSKNKATGDMLKGKEIQRGFFDETKE